MLDVLLFIPRLIIDIFVLIWNIIVFVWEFLVWCITAFLPVETGNWGVLIGVSIWLILSFILRKEFGGFLKSLLLIFVSLLVGFFMWKLNPIGLVITLLIAVLVGFQVIKGTRFVYIFLGFMWAGMIVYAVMY